MTEKPTDHLVMLGRDLILGKSLQVYIEEVPYLIIGRDDRKHNDTLKMFLLNKQIPFIQERLYGPNFGPPAMGDNYRLVGAGLANLLYAGRIVLSGQSDSYRISPNAEHAKEISDILGMAVEIEDPKSTTTTRSEKHLPDKDDELPF